MVKKKIAKKSKKKTVAKKATKKKAPSKPKKPTADELAEEQAKLAAKEDKKRLAGIATKRDALIREISGKVLSNSALRRGGSAIRSKHAVEAANFAPVIAEINELGAQLGVRQIGLGNFRG